MELSLTIDTTFEIKSLFDLPRLRQVMVNLGLKINKSQLARDLGVNRKTIDKYLQGFAPKIKRDRKSIIDPYYEIIASLLSEDCIQKFYYMRVLWQYLKDNHGLACSPSSFRRYINHHDEFQAYFKEDRRIKSQKGAPRFETLPGKQAQLDWKESIPYVTSEGEMVDVNVAALVLSNSRFRTFHLSLSKTQSVLFNFLTESFEKLGGVPEEILTDNMRTVMDEARTENTPGKVNVRFEQFAKDFGFKVKPCIAGRPRTKGKVETQMKLLDEIHAYQGKFTIGELANFVQKLCNRVNHEVHQGTNKIPILEFQKEKSHLTQLPTNSIRDSYKIHHKFVKVNTSNMISYKSNQYSVPSGYCGKKVAIQTYDNNLWIYCNTKLLAQHAITNKKINYLFDHYQSAMGSVMDINLDIDTLARKNLEILGEVFE
jgi:transposase